MLPASEPEKGDIKKRLDKKKGLWYYHVHSWRKGKKVHIDKRGDEWYNRGTYQNHNPDLSKKQTSHWEPKSLYV